MILIEFGLLLIPSLAYLIYNRKLVNKKIMLIFSSLCTIIVLSILGRISFRIDFIDLLCLQVLYFFYCILICYCLKIRIKIIKIGTLIVGIIPVILGYLLATIGFLIVIEISSAFADYKLTKMDETHYLKESHYGFAFSETSGTTIGIYQTWKNIPGLEKKLFNENQNRRSDY